MKENNKEQDLHLQPPGEANREKHINFLKEEEESTKKEEAKDNLDSPFFIPSNNPYQRLNNGEVAAGVKPISNDEVENNTDNEDQQQQA